MYQLFRGLAYIHSAGIIHRDVTPGNLLLTEDSGLIISDFGMARFVGEDTSCIIRMTTHVTTRWYSAPEQLMNASTFAFGPIDVFACGCVMAEIIRRKPLFPGDGNINQLEIMIGLLGFPEKELLLWMVGSEYAS